MLRALALPKYVPAGLCGLLIVVWIASVPLSFGAGLPGVAWGSDLGSLALILGWGRFASISLRPASSISQESWMGKLGKFTFGNSLFFYVPIPLVITLLLPLAIAPRYQFRFPLWSYFAWTALIAAELAFYLR
jgi:hypothetical protein